MKVNKILQDIGWGFVFGVGVIGSAVLVPIVSAVALPIFAAKAAYHGIHHHILYQRTLTDGKRAEFGRIQGQDYTRWNGKIFDRGDKPLSKKKQDHILAGEYSHGLKKDPISESPNVPADCPFRTVEDRNWLGKEQARIIVKNELDEDKKFIKLFLKLLIPIGGIVWAVSTETQPGGLSVCCPQGGDKHWKLNEAAQFHKTRLERMGAW